MEAAASPELEIDLVARATAGDLPAFEELVSRYQRAIFNVALYKSRNYFDAEDLTQDIFLAAFKALGTLKTPESFGAWLFGIAYNRCHKWYQRERNKILKIHEIQEREARKERLRLRSAQGLPAPPSLPGETPASATASEHLSEVLLRLPAEIRETLTLKYLEGLSYHEIEERLGINAHRIDYLIRKGKQLLRQRAPGLQGEGEA